MNLFLSIFWLFLFAILFLCAWKMIEPNKSVAEILKEIKSLFSGTPQPTEQQNTYSDDDDYSLYKQYRMDYQNFATIVADFMKSVNKKYGVKFSENPAKIFVPEYSDRVKLYSNGRTFIYEVGPDTFTMGDIQGKNIKKINEQNLQTFFRNNLKGALWGGYFFTGPVYVRYKNDTEIRIEVQGVDRQYQNPNAGGIVI